MQAWRQTTEFKSWASCPGWSSDLSGPKMGGPNFSNSGSVADGKFLP